MRTRTAWLGLLVALCACGKAFEANGGPDGTAAAGVGGVSSHAGAGAGGNSGGTAARAGSGGTLAAAGVSAGFGGVPAIAGFTGSGGVAGLAAGGAIGDAGGTAPIPLDGLALWLRADRGVVAPDGTVQEWLDQSGQGMDAIQTATNLRPKFAPTGLNHLPTLDFDGVDDVLKLPPGFSDFGNGVTWLVVLNVTDAGCSSVVEFSNGSEVQDLSLGVYQNIWQYEVLNDDLSGGQASPQPVLFGALHHPTQAVELRLDSMQIGASSFLLPENIVRQQNFVGGTLYADCNTFKGQVSEILLYSRAVTDKELLAIEGYLQSHWSLTF